LRLTIRDAAERGLRRPSRSLRPALELHQYCSRRRLRSGRGHHRRRAPGLLLRGCGAADLRPPRLKQSRLIASPWRPRLRPLKLTPYCPAGSAAGRRDLPNSLKRHPIRFHKRASAKNLVLQQGAKAVPRTGDGKAANFLFTRPGWQGAVPAGM
jgi:hypothetical protein